MASVKVDNIKQECKAGGHYHLYNGKLPVFFLGMVDDKGSGKKFERKKVRIAEKVQLFSSRTFFLKFFLGPYRTRGPTEMADHSF